MLLSRHSILLFTAVDYIFVDPQNDIARHAIKWTPSQLSAHSYGMFKCPFHVPVYCQAPPNCPNADSAVCNAALSQPSYVGFMQGPSTR